MAISEEKKLELLNDHYKDSFVQIKDHIKVRGQLFFLTLVTVTLQLFRLFSPQDANNLLILFHQNQVGAEEPLTLDFSFVQTVVWFALLALVIRYYQTVVTIERQ